MAIIFPLATYNNQALESQSETVPNNGKSYDFFCEPTNFTDPAQGIRNEVLESVNGGQTWTVATSNPPITPTNPDPYIDGGLDRFGQQRKAGLYGLTSVASRQVKVRTIVRGSVRLRSVGNVNTG